MLRPAFPLVAAVLLLAGCGEQGGDAPAQPAPVAADAGQASKAFDAALDQLSRSYYQQVPEAATYNGIPQELTSGADARLNDRSVVGEETRVSEMEKHLVTLKAVPADSLSDEQRRVRDTLITLFDGAIGPSRLVDCGSSFDAYGNWYLPYAINQNSGVTVDIPKLMEAQQTVRNADEAKKYLARLELLPGILDGALAKMQHDVKLGAIPPDFIIHWRLPNGAALYKAMIRHMTDSDLDPEAVHQADLEEVARISAEMDSLWSREEAIDYMMATEGADEAGATSEIERYVVWPGQALGYKIGMLRIQQLRKEAEAAYGDKFDIREFHDRLLVISASALPVIEADMRAWIAKPPAQQNSKP